MGGRNAEAGLHQCGGVFFEEPLHFLLVRVHVEQLLKHCDIRLNSFIISGNGQPSVLGEFSSVSRNKLIFAFLILSFTLQSLADLCSTLDDADHHAAIFIFLHQSVVRS